MKFRPGNIWSGSRELAVLTNPTELAFRKGNLKKHYPIIVWGVEHADVESAYKEYKTGDMAWNKNLMIVLIKRKLETYPLIKKTIEESGGVGFLKQCSHVINGERWEGEGTGSMFIMALIAAYVAAE